MPWNGSSSRLQVSANQADGPPRAATKSICLTRKGPGCMRGPSGRSNWKSQMKTIADYAGQGTRCTARFLRSKRRFRNEIVYSSGHNKWSCVTAGLDCDCHSSFSSFSGGANSNAGAKHSGEFHARRPYRLDRRLVVRGERRRANFRQRGTPLPNGGSEAARHS
jgi:hypothetical protein